MADPQTAAIPPIFAPIGPIPTPAPIPSPVPPAPPLTEDLLMDQISAVLSAAHMKIQPQLTAIAKLRWPKGWQAPTVTESRVCSRPVGGNAQIGKIKRHVIEVGGWTSEQARP